MGLALDQSWKRSSCCWCSHHSCPHATLPQGLLAAVHGVVMMSTCLSVPRRGRLSIGASLQDAEPPPELGFPCSSQTHPPAFSNSPHHHCLGPWRASPSPHWCPELVIHRKWVIRCPRGAVPHRCPPGPPCMGLQSAGEVRLELMPACGSLSQPFLCIGALPRQHLCCKRGQCDGPRDSPVSSGLGPQTPFPPCSSWLLGCPRA